MIEYPYIFIDTAIWSDTYLQYCIKVSDSLSYDGYSTMREAIQTMNEIADENLYFKGGFNHA